MLRRATIAMLLAAMTAIAPASAQQFKIIPREKLDSLANPVAAADSPMRFERSAIDAGTINEDDAPSRYRFHWHNDGSEPLVVTEVRTGCGCAAADYDRRAVGPGEEGVITITYHPKGHPGRFRRKITVHTQSTGRPAAVLELTGEVIPSVLPTHNYPHVMGSLRLKRTEVAMESTERRVVESIEVLNAGEKPLRITADSRLLPEYLAVRSNPETIEAGMRADIEISFDPTKVRARIPERIPVILEGTDDLPPSRRTIYVNFNQ